MRRLQIAVTLVAALLLASCSAAAQLLGPRETWTMYQRSPDHNAIVSRAEFTRTWKLDAGGQINGGMAVRGNVLYVDTLAGDLLAVDLDTGRVIWRAHTPHALMSTPVFDGDMVYVGSGTAQLPAGKEPQWGKRDMIMGVRGGDAVYAYDAATGKLRWSFATRGQDMPSPAVYKHVLVFANGDFHAYGLDARTGRLLWKRSLPGMATMASTLVAGDRAFISTCRYLLPYHCDTFALDPLSGRVLWRAPYGNADASPAYAQGTVFVSGLDYTRAKQRWRALQEAYAVVAALDADTGKPKWVFHDTQAGFPSDVGTAERAVAGTYADGKYFQALPGRGLVVAFDAASGSVVWQFHSLSPIKMSPLLYRDVLYAGGNEGLLYSLDASNGKLLQLRTFRQPFSCAPPLLIGDTMLVATDRFVTALPVSSLTDQAAAAGIMKK